MKTKKWPRVMALALAAVIGIIGFGMGLFMVTDVYADEPYYQWTGTQESGYTWGGVGVSKFIMSGGHVAFCVDINTVIQKNQDYIRLPLEKAADMGWLKHPEKVRAILNYSWDKTGKDEITAIQYALWKFMNGHDLPGNAPKEVVKIYKKLLDDAQTPPIPASHENIINDFKLAPITPNPLNDQSFEFKTWTSLDIDIKFDIYLNGQLLDPGKYYLEEIEDGRWVFKYLGEFEYDMEFVVVGTTLKNKSVGAWVFFAVDEDGNINPKLSQTVAGIKPSQTMQTLKIAFRTKEEPPPTTQPPTTEPPTTEEPTITEPPTTEEPTTTEAPTEPPTETQPTTQEATTPTTEAPTEPPTTTEAPPEETTTIIVTTEPPTEIPEEDYPVTAERRTWLGIAFMFFGAAVITIVGVWAKYTYLKKND